MPLKSNKHINTVTRAAALFITLFLFASPAMADRLLERAQQLQRQEVDITKSPWRAIGRVAKQTGGYCTGVVVGEHHVVTAAHCLWDTAQEKPYPVCGLRFVIGYDRGRYDLAVPVVQSSPVSSPAKSALYEDWAILTLSRDVRAEAGVLPLVTLSGLNESSSSELLQAGFHKDKPHVLSRNQRCQIVQRTTGNQLFLHDCIVDKGDSGSPLLIETDNSYAMVGIHIALHTRPDSGERYGVAIDARAIQDWLDSKANETTDEVPGPC